MQNTALATISPDGEPTTTSLVIAEHTENDHASVIKLVRAHLGDLEEFGTIGFEIRKSGGRPTEYAILSEPQATLLITYMRNGEQVKRFKKALVHAFFTLRQEIARRKPELPDRRALAQMVIDAEDRADAERAARQALEAPAAAWSHLASSHGDYSVADAAKILSRDPQITIGRDRLFTFMESEGWIYRGAGERRKPWRAYQAQVDLGRLTERISRPYLNERTGEMTLPDPTVRITAKGLAKLHLLLGGSGSFGVLAVTA